MTAPTLLPVCTLPKEVSFQPFSSASRLTVHVIDAVQSRGTERASHSHIRIDVRISHLQHHQRRAKTGLGIRTRPQIPSKPANRRGVGVQLPTQSER